MAACGCYAAPAERAAPQRPVQPPQAPQRSRDAPADRRPGRALVCHADRQLPHGQALPLGPQDQLGVEDVAAKLTGLHERQQARSLDGLDAVGVAHVQPEAVPEQHREHRGHDPAPDAPLIV